VIAPAVANWIQHEEALGALRVALTTLEEAGVPVLVVKGMVLAYALYDDVAERPMADVDLRIRPRDFLRAVGAMERRGFPAQWTSRQLGAVAFRIGNTLVEIEMSVGPPGLCALTVAQMMARSGTRVLGGELRVREPDVHDHAVLLVVNAFKDKMVECPKHSLDDLDTIAGRIDVPTFLERVEAARLRTVTWVAADWMARERRSDAWRDIRDRVGSRAPRALYAATMLKLLSDGHDTLGASALARVGSDSPTQRGYALAATALGTAVWCLAPTF
jgi:hypothetical protein